MKATTSPLQYVLLVLSAVVSGLTLGLALEKRLKQGIVIIVININN